jgi:hypothetical protein
VMQRIAVPMIGGMVSSTAPTLVVIPAVYILIKGCPVTRRKGNRPLIILANDRSSRIASRIFP